MFCERLREAVRIQQPIRARCKHGLCHGYAIELYHSSRTTEWRLAARLLKLNQHDLGIRPDAYRRSPPSGAAGGIDDEVSQTLQPGTILPVRAGPDSR